MNTAHAETLTATRTLADQGRELRTLAAVILLIPTAVAIIMALFAWPAARLAPRDLPLGVAGPPQAVAPLEQQLARNEGAFAVRRYPDEAAAREAIRAREVYGAVVIGPDGPTLLTASAASPLVAQLLQGAVAPATPSGTAAAPPVRVVDVVPASAADPRGAVFGALILPLVLAGEITGALITLVTRPGGRQIGGLLAISALVGLAGVGIAQGWLGVLGGDWLTNAGALGLTVLAIGAGLAGLSALWGRVGLGLGGLLILLVGNPFSGLGSAPELLPPPAGVIGQLLPIGAGGNLLRSTAFFDGGGAGEYLSVLGVWVVVGLALVWVGALRGRNTA